MRTPEKICGILGGMGPEATVHLLNRIIRNTDAGEDGHHVRCLVDQNPQVPSRIKAILYDGADPGPVLSKMARALESAGANFLCMPCNTAHHWLDEVRAQISIPFLDMPALAVADAARNAGGKKCAILGTTATRNKKIYDSRCACCGMEAIYPNEADQAEVLNIINEVKAGNYTGAANFARIAQSMAADGAAAVILACTELSVLGLPDTIDAAVIDALDSLAREVVKQSGADLKE